MKEIYSKNSQKTEKKLEKLKKDFCKLIPQLREIQETQRTYKEIQRKKVGKQYPFINTQTSSTV